MNRYVYHCAPEEGQTRIDGRNFNIPPRMPFELEPITGMDSHLTGTFEYTIPSAHLAADILDKLKYLGMVEVAARKVAVPPNGFRIEFDIDKAHELAEKALVAAENDILEKWVLWQRQRIQQGSPALPPVGRVLTIIERHKIDVLSKWGISPVGYNAIEQAETRKAAESEQARVLAIQAEKIEKMEKDNAELRTLVARTLEALAAKDDPKKKG